MSGMVGLVNFNREPVDAVLLERMTDALDFRGPDGRGAWSDGSAGFGHTLLRTTYEGEQERQPLSFDGRTWIVADCRVDGREALVAKLAAKGRPARLDRPDVELILHAWHAWGEGCVDHLLGDFAFAVWEGAARRLTLVRDHLGVKPLFYAEAGRALVFSNTLDCVRLHPGVPDGLNEAAIGEFLVFGGNQGEATTSYASIMRVPRAHIMTWTAMGRSTHRYWELPVEEPVYRRHPADYVEAFSALLTTAVSDRLRVPTVSVFMSGGLDSTTLAAEARGQLGGSAAQPRVRARTLIVGPDDEERHFACLTARFLGIGIDVRDTRATAGPAAAWRVGPEPETTTFVEADDWTAMAAHSRVAFHGEGPDNALAYDWRRHLAGLLRQRRFGAAAADIVRDRLAQPRLPGLASLWRARRIRPSPLFLHHVYPDGLNPDLEARLGLRERWDAAFGPADARDPGRPRAHRSFDLPLWRAMFDSFDPDATGATVEVRHPFLDLRLLSFMLSIPTLPWRRRKYLIRRSMRGRLPPEVLMRDKSPLPASRVEPPGIRDPLVALAPQARAYFNDGVEKLGDIADPQTGSRAETLNVWLRDRAPLSSGYS